MTEIFFPQEEGEPIAVELRDPYWAAFLAWVWPGAGHFYQRRFAKGFLFMTCVLCTYFFGLLVLGHGRVVYASFAKDDFRWQYIPQLGVGAPALPALAQRLKTKTGGDPYWVLCERYPKLKGSPGNYIMVNGEKKRCFSIVEDPSAYPSEGPRPYKDGFMAPPMGPKFSDENDVLGEWHSSFKHKYELGTLYTVVAGLLNLLAIYDAFVGPAILTEEEKAEIERKQQERDKKKAKKKGEL